ncbi:hypothetical protein JST97_36805, partial [bacterium]|nr:hypothetical protein [bacterium]
QRSKLVGLLASKGNLHLSDLTVVGAVVCAGSADRVLEMSNVNVLGNSAGLDFAFELGWGRAATSYGLVGGGTRGGAGRLVRMVAKPDGRGGMRPAVPTDFIDRYDPRNPGADLIQPGDFEVVELDSSGQPVLGPDHQPIAHSFSESGLDFNDPFLVGKLLEKLQDTARTQAQSPTESIMSAGKLSLDLNKFLKVGETLQVVFRTIR